MNYFKISRFLLYLIPLGIIIITPSSLFPFVVGKYVLFRILSALALIFFLVGLLFSREGEKYWNRFKNIAKHPLFISVATFTGAFVISGFFGVDPHFSFWSNFERGEGGLQMLHMFAFFALLATLFKENNWKKMFWFMITSGIFVILYGVGAGLGIDGLLGPEFNETFSRFQGSVGNPAYVAVYLIFAMFFAGYLLSAYFKKKEPQRTILIILIAIFFAFFILAATRGAFLGLGAGIFTALLYLGISQKSWRRPALSILVVLIILVSVMFAFRDTETVKNIPGSRIFDISLKAETFQDRMIMWGIAMEGFKERPIFGWGPGNFLTLFQEKYDPAYYDPASGDYGAWFDRAHSVIFDYLAETGIIGFLAYLSIFISLFIYLTKTKIKKVGEGIRKNWSPTLKALLVSMPVAYLVQGLVLFDVSTTYIPLFTLLAFTLYKFEELNKPENEHA